MQFFRTSHALRRMQERGISEIDVIDTLRNFEISEPGNNGGRALYGKVVDGSRVIVWIAGNITAGEVVIVKSVIRRDK